MERYRNRSGNSGIAFFEMSDHSISVKFTDGSVYIYDQTRPGVYTVERMKQLARQGEGLNEFINRRVGKNYARKLR